MSKSITPLMDARLTAEGAERGRLKAAAERDTLRAEVERLQSEMEDLMFALADAEHRAENAGRNASAFEDRMGDLQVENGKLRAEVEQLRQQAARYERLRRLNPRQFAELHQRNLAGERFDDMVAGGAE